LKSTDSNGSDVEIVMALLLDALGQRHSLRGGLRLSTAHCACLVSTGTLEGAVLKSSAIGIQEAGHALAEAFGLRTMANVLACRPVAAEVRSAEEGLRHRALRGDASSNSRAKRGISLFHAGHETGFIAAGTAERARLRRGAPIISQARLHVAGAVAHSTLAFLWACSGAAIHTFHARSKNVGQALALDTFHKWSSEWRSSLSHTVKQAALIPAWALEGAVLVTCTSLVPHAIIDHRLAL